MRSRDRGFCISSSAINNSSFVASSRLDAYNEVLKSAGAILPKRDAVDTRISNEVKNNTGKIINSQSEVGGYPTYNSGTAYTDTDKDGMPNDWENKYGFNPNNASDGNEDTDKDGYTNVEEFLNGTLPKENITDISSENIENQIQIFPNPASGELYISGNIDVNDAYEITSIEGKTLQIGRYKQSSISLEGLEAGMYLIKIKTNTGELVQRFVKE
jgi:hypothetical protein